MSTAPLGELPRPLSRSLPHSLFAVALLLASVLPARAQASRESDANAAGHMTPPYAAQLQRAAPAVATPARTATAYPGASAPDPVQRLMPGLTPRSYPPKAGEPGPTPPLPACGVISDCSFEAGAVGWGGSDIAGPLLTLGVYAAGLNQGYGFFSSAPTDGGLCVLTGFDGNGPGDITVFQDVILQPKADRLVFDFRAGWDLLNFVATSTLPRTFFVEIEPFGGGPALSSATVLTVPPLTFNLDTGDITTAISVAAFAGQPVRIKFRWNVPESYTGPAICQLDHVRILENDCGVVSNCSFETGTFPGWLTLDMPSPYFAMSIVGPGVSVGFGLFATAPSDGLSTYFTGFDGGGPADSKLVQDVTLPADAFSLDFDWRAGWDMQTFGGSTLPRELFVEVEPPGGGAAFQSTRILNAPAGTKLLDSGPRKGLVDISRFAGQTVRLVFRVHIPQSFTGPGQLAIDHVQVTREPCASIADCSYEAGGVPSWTLTDLAPPFIAMHVGGAGEVNGFGSFATAPTNGNLALIHGFDGAGPAAITAVQDLRLPLWADQLRFDYRAAWDMLTFGGSTRPRLFVVEVQPSGGGPAFVSDVALVAPPHTQLGDTGPRSRTLPVGAFAGQDVRIVFRWEVPEYFTGPAFFQLDHVTLGSNPLDAGPGAKPRTLSLSPAAPNPSRESAAFRFTLPAVSDVQLEVVDVRGARVWSEQRTALPAGEHQIAWNGVKSGGGLAPAGVYYARVRTPDGTRSRMFVRVR